jgi:hypothetical protein
MVRLAGLCLIAIFLLVPFVAIMEAAQGDDEYRLRGVLSRSVIGARNCRGGEAREYVPVAEQICLRADRELPPLPVGQKVVVWWRAPRGAEEPRIPNLPSAREAHYLYLNDRVCRFYARVAKSGGNGLTLVAGIGHFGFPALFVRHIHALPSGSTLTFEVVPTEVMHESEGAPGGINAETMRYLAAREGAPYIAFLVNGSDLSPPLPAALAMHLRW